MTADPADVSYLRDRVLFLLWRLLRARVREAAAMECAKKAAKAERKAERKAARGADETPEQRLERKREQHRSYMRNRSRTPEGVAWRRKYQREMYGQEYATLIKSGGAYPDPSGCGEGQS